MRKAFLYFPKFGKLEYVFVVVNILASQDLPNDDVGIN